jgi:hypothetical protein
MPISCALLAHALMVRVIDTRTAHVVWICGSLEGVIQNPKSEPTNELSLVRRQAGWAVF